MRICIYGAGAIGALMGGKLAAAGHDVTLIARGAHGEAMARDGVRLEVKGETAVVRPRVTADASGAVGAVYVILTMKAHGVPAALAALAPHLGPETTVVSAQNGLPWWYFHRLGAALGGGALEGRPLRSVDPDGDMLRTFPSDRLVGCVVVGASAVVAPGVVRSATGGSYTLGEPDGSLSTRARQLAAALEGAGFGARVSQRIRDDIWAKLWGNVSFSAIAVLTGSGLASLANDPATADLARTMMAEAQAVAEALGARMPMTIPERIEQTKRMGDHKTSILQDLEAGRPMEVDAMIGCVCEAGRIAGVATPIIDGVYGLVRRRARVAGCYPENRSFDPFG
jgi:2-dehydropantoate 2-reductase